MAMAIRRRKVEAVGKSAASFNTEDAGRDVCPLAADSTLPGKTSKESGRCPYYKPTQVDEMNIHRRSRERSLRN
jgi:hypothetical protein